MKKFVGTDFGIIALAKNYPAEKIWIKISSCAKASENKSRDFDKKDAISEKDFWFLLVKKIVEEKTKFGRVGIVFDRKNKDARSFCNKLAKQNFAYRQKNPRAEKSAKFSILETQILREMANEGLADSVEFRRLARKHIRRAKTWRVDSLIFLEGIFAEKRTRQILQKLAGTQLKVYFLTDLLTDNSPLIKWVGGISDQNPDLKDSPLLPLLAGEGGGEVEKNPAVPRKAVAKKSFQIATDDDLNFTKKRAEQILQRKLKICDVFSV